MSKARKDEKYYVVNRIANDKWLTKSCPDSEIRQAIKDRFGTNAIDIVWID